jgi:hypothetical protein
MPPPPVNRAPTEPQPWWRVSMMWLVLLGPVAVVLAGVWTAVLAVRGADSMVRTSARGADRPAVQARNHAATPPAAAQAVQRPPASGANDDPAAAR